MLDANIFISYVLSPDARGTIRLIVDAAFRKEFTLLVSDRLLEELVRKVVQKTYIAKRVTIEDIADVLSAIGDIAEKIPAISEEIPAISRDPKDDYLLAYAVIAAAE